VILKHCHESEKPHKGCENVPRDRVTRTSAMPFRFSLGTVIMIPDALVAIVVNVSLFSMWHNNLKSAALNVISCCTWDMRNTYRILVGHCEKIAQKEHMEVDYKEIRCKLCVT
jgi:hypothetical protein